MQGLLFLPIEMYTDESPGLKVDPVIVLVLSLGFIFSVVALHSKLTSGPKVQVADKCSNCKGFQEVLVNSKGWSLTLGPMV